MFPDIPVNHPSARARSEPASAAGFALSFPSTIVDSPSKRVKVGDTWIEYRIRRSRKRKKTCQISVRSGEVLLEAPYRTTNRQAEEIVLQKARWILDKLAVKEPEPTALQFLSGERLPYQGQELTLWVEGAAETATGRPLIFLDRKRLKIAVPMGLADDTRQTRIGEAILEWYEERAFDQVWAHIGRWWPALGRGEAPLVRIRNQRRRWGSCSSDGVLRFNWRLAMLEPSLTEYVVVHELAHLTHMNHSPDFWSLVERHLPDVKERRRRLKEAGATLPQL